MRKVMVITIGCALLLMVVAATPAFGWAVQPEPGAYVFVFSGAWHEITPDGQDILHDWTPVDPNDPEGDWNPPAAIPTDMDIWLYFRWVSPTRGVVQTLPLGMYVKLDTYSVIDINADPWELGDLAFSVPTYADGATLWSHAYPWDGEALDTFNGKVGAKFWAIDWWAPVGRLDPGFYLVFSTQRFAHSVPDLSSIEEDQYTPVVTKRGVAESLAGFVVAEP